MAARGFFVAKAGIALVAATPKTVIQVVAATNHAVELRKLEVGFHGTNNTHESILVEVVRQSDAGTSSALTPVKSDDSVADALDVTARHTATVEPTTGDVLKVFSIPPQSGMIEPLDVGEIIVGAADRAGIRITAPNNNTVDVTVHAIE